MHKSLIVHRRWLGRATGLLVALLPWLMAGSTVNIDRLAQRGMRFTNAHSPSSVCTPTRYGLLTGQYAWRVPVPSDCSQPFRGGAVDHGVDYYFGDDVISQAPFTFIENDRVISTPADRSGGSSSGQAAEGSSRAPAPWTRAFLSTRATTSPGFSPPSRRVERRRYRCRWRAQASALRGRAASSTGTGTSWPGGALSNSSDALEIQFVP